MRSRILIIGILMFVLAGCGVSPATNQVNSPVPSQTFTPQLSQTTPQDLTEITTQSKSPTQTVAPLPNVKTKPTVRPDLEASDPATFHLAGGKLQLIEFFAYW